MDTFSLEEDDYEGLFITQTSNAQPVENVSDAIKGCIIYFEDECENLSASKAPQYSDISDDDFEKTAEDHVVDRGVKAIRR